MKTVSFYLLFTSIIFACTTGTREATSDSTASVTDSVKTIPDTKLVSIPEKGADWIDHRISETNPKVIISTPKGMQVFADSYSGSISVRLSEYHSMYIQPKALDMKEQRQWYLDSRKDLQWLIDTDTEVLYTGTDLTAPKGHQATNSFYATRKIGATDFSTSVDGITIQDVDHIYNLSMEDCQLFLGIFRTLRAQ